MWHIFIKQNMAMYGSAVGFCLIPILYLCLIRSPDAIQLLLKWQYQRLLKSLPRNE